MVAQAQSQPTQQAGHLDDDNDDSVNDDNDVGNDDDYDDDDYDNDDYDNDDDNDYVVCKDNDED